MVNYLVNLTCYNTIVVFGFDKVPIIISSFWGDELTTFQSPLVSARPSLPLALIRKSLSNSSAYVFGGRDIS